MTPFQERFWAKVQKAGPDECWLWTAGTYTQGYGAIGSGRSSLRAHRVAYEELVGPIPDDMTIDHLCRVKRCVNPAHMEVVTARENTLRGLAANGLLNKPYCKRGHPREQNRRRCRRCKSNLDRVRRAQRRKMSTLTAEQERARIGRILTDWRGHGFDSLVAAVDALWPATQEQAA